MVNKTKTNHQAALNKANKEIEDKKDVVKGTPYRLNYHFMAPIGWIRVPTLLSILPICSYLGADALGPC
jgi:sucrose-6-phosphate hydrolase SacC (GH32 family)